MILTRWTCLKNSLNTADLNNTLSNATQFRSQNNVYLYLCIFIWFDLKPLDPFSLLPQRAKLCHHYLKEAFWLVLNLQVWVFFLNLVMYCILIITLANRQKNWNKRKRNWIFQAPFWTFVDSRDFSILYISKTKNEHHGDFFFVVLGVPLASAKRPWKKNHFNCRSLFQCRENKNRLVIRQSWSTEWSVQLNPSDGLSYSELPSHSTLHGKSWKYQVMDWNERAILGLGTKPFYAKFSWLPGIWTNDLDFQIVFSKQVSNLDQII